MIKSGKNWGHPYCATSSFVHHFIAIGEFKLGLTLQSGNAQFGSKLGIFVECDLGIRRMTLKNKKALHLCYFKLCAWFHSHRWIQSGFARRKRPIWVKAGDFLSCVTSKFDRWPWKNNRAPLLCHVKLCASFHLNKLIQTRVMVWKRLNWVLTSVTLIFDFWPWRFAWTSLHNEKYKFF